MNRRPTLLLLLFQPSKLLKRSSHLRQFSLHLLLRPPLHLAVVRPPRTGPGLAHATQSRARLCCSCRPTRARDTSTTAFPLRALQVVFGNVFTLRTLKYKLLKRSSHLRQLSLSTSSAAHRSTSPSYARREQDLVSLTLHSHGRAFVAHAVPRAQEIQVQRPFPYVHSRLPLGMFSHLAA